MSVPQYYAVKHVEGELDEHCHGEIQHFLDMQSQRLQARIHNDHRAEQTAELLCAQAEQDVHNRIAQRLQGKFPLKRQDAMTVPSEKRQKQINQWRQYPNKYEDPEMTDNEKRWIKLNSTHSRARAASLAPDDDDVDESPNGAAARPEILRRQYTLHSITRDRLEKIREFLANPIANSNVHITDAEKNTLKTMPEFKRYFQA
jgi:hypothetical protein